ncbi:hypothetical protein AAY473_012786 [Plecturocebus cupreus]
MAPRGRAREEAAPGGLRQLRGAHPLLRDGSRVWAWGQPVGPSLRGPVRGPVGGPGGIQLPMQWPSGDQREQHCGHDLPSWNISEAEIEAQKEKRPGEGLEEIPRRRRVAGSPRSTGNTVQQGGAGGEDRSYCFPAQFALFKAGFHFILLHMAI